MDSKLQEHAAAAGGDSSSITSEKEEGKLPWPRDADTPTSSVLRLAETHLDLREAIIKYEAILDYLERLYAEKVVLCFQKHISAY